MNPSTVELGSNNGTRRTPENEFLHQDLQARASTYYLVLLHIQHTTGYMAQRRSCLLHLKSPTL